MPSSGLFPFLRGIACELNNSCHNVPIEPDSSGSANENQFYQLFQLATDVFKFTNQSEVVSSATTLTEYFRDILNLREEAGAITRNLTLSQYLYINLTTFTETLNSLLNNSALVEKLLSSNPNYNFLYSNFSVKYTEENFVLSNLISTNENNPQQFIDLLYGPDLGVSTYTL